MSSPPLNQRAKKPAGRARAGTVRKLGCAATKLNGLVLLRRTWTQNTVFRVSTATLLRGFDPHVAKIGGIRTRYWVGGVRPSARPRPRPRRCGAELHAARAAPRASDTGCSSRTCRATAAPRRCPTSRASPTWAPTSRRWRSTKRMLPAAIVGYSMGGVVALRLAAERPEAVSRLALIASAGIVSLSPAGRHLARRRGRRSPGPVGRQGSRRRRAPAQPPRRSLRLLGRRGSALARPRGGGGLPRGPARARGHRQRVARSATRGPADVSRPCPLPRTRRLGRPRPARAPRGRLRLRAPAPGAAADRPGRRPPRRGRVPARVRRAPGRLSRNPVALAGVSAV